MLPIPPSWESLGVPSIPECHREMFAEWVRQGKPQMEFINPLQNDWRDCVGDPKWLSQYQYRFKDEQSFEEGIAEIRESMKAPRHLLDEMPIAKEFKASSEDPFKDAQLRAAEAITPTVAEYLSAKPTEHDAGQPTSALQTQVGGDHYAKLKIQPAKYCHANGIGHMAGDAISYITRYKDKNGKQDLLKAIHSLQLLIELEYGDEG